MKTPVLLMLLAFSITGCNAQEQKKTVAGTNTIASEQQVKPEVHTNVVKTYDEHGNVVGYDSTYTWSYSSNGGAAFPLNTDSLLQQFRQGFDLDFPMLNDDGPMSWNDSLFYNQVSTTERLMQAWKQQLQSGSGIARRKEDEL